MAVVALLVAVAGVTIVSAETGFQELFVDQAGTTSASAPPSPAATSCGRTGPSRWVAQTRSGLAPNGVAFLTCIQIMRQIPEISNDTKNLKALMLLGNSSGGNQDRREVKIYDDLLLPQAV
jgi:hypothetical protein